MDVSLPFLSIVSSFRSSPKMLAAYRPIPLRPCKTLPIGLLFFLNLSSVDGTSHLLITSSGDIP